MTFRDLIREATPHRVASFDGIELAVLEWPGDGGTILLVHATGFHKEMWVPVVAELRRQGITATVLAADMRGHGDSDAPEALSWWDYGRDVEAVMGALVGVGPAIGVGHSMGGGAILGAEVRVPSTFAGIVVADPAAMSVEFLTDQERRFGNPWADGARRRRDRYPSRAAAMDNFSSKEVFATWVEGLLEVHGQYGLAEIPGGVVLKCSPTWEAMTFGCSDMVELWPHLQSITCPVTLMTAEHSVTHPPAHAVETAVHLRARHVRLPGVGHFFPMERPTWVAIEVARMYESVR